jgi:hypothetical protein
LIELSIIRDWTNLDDLVVGIVFVAVGLNGSFVVDLTCIGLGV